MKDGIMKHPVNGLFCAPHPSQWPAKSHIFIFVALKKIIKPYIYFTQYEQIKNPIKSLLV